MIETVLSLQPNLQLCDQTQNIEPRVKVSLMQNYYVRLVFSEVQRQEERGQVSITLTFSLL